MIPLIELKGAIPFGMSSELFGSNALTPFSAWVAASVGSFIPAIFLVWLFVPLMNKLRGRKLFRNLSQRLENRYKLKAEKIKGKTLKKCLLLVLFVAIPLPLTGAYTGSIVAALASIGYLNAILSIFIGNLIAGGIVVLLCTIFAGYELYILLGFLLLIVLFILVSLIRSALKKRQNKKPN